MLSHSNLEHSRVARLDDAALAQHDAALLAGLEGENGGGFILSEIIIRAQIYTWLKTVATVQLSECLLGAAPEVRYLVNVEQDLVC